MKIGIITTLHHNIGDDFVRHGIQNICKEIFSSPEFVLINKHNPIEVYNENSIQRKFYNLLNKLTGRRRSILKIIAKFMNNADSSKFGDCQLIIQSGAPVYFDGAYDTEWSELIWKTVIRKLSKDRVVMNLAAGSCFAWIRRHERNISNEDREFYNLIHDICGLTIVRDSLASDLLNDMKLNHHKLPCTALLVSENSYEFPEDGYVLINYMKDGGHYKFGQKIDNSSWLSNLKKIINLIETSEEILFVCHTEQELIDCNLEFPNYRKVLANSVADYIKILSQAKTGIFNRLHAAVAMASIGRKSLAIGVDTRMLMLEEIGIDYIFINDVVPDDIQGKIKNFLNDKQINFSNIKQQTKSNYISLIKDCYHNEFNSNC